MQKLSKIQVIVGNKRFRDEILQETKGGRYTYLTFKYLCLTNPQDTISFQGIVSRDTTVGEIIKYMGKILRLSCSALVLGYERDGKEEMYKGWMKADRLYLIHTATTKQKWFGTKSSYERACQIIKRHFGIIHNIHIIPDKIYPQYKPYSLYCEDNPQGLFSDTTFDNFFTNIVSNKTVKETLTAKSVSPYSIFTLCPEEIYMPQTLNLDNLTKKLFFATLCVPKNIKYTPITPMPSWVC